MLSTLKLIELGLGEPGDRDQLDTREITRSSEDAASQIKQQILLLRSILFVLGMKVCDPFHNKDKNKESNVYPRIRWSENTFSPSFSWEKRIKKYIPLAISSPIQPKKGKGYSYMTYIENRSTGRRIPKKVVLLSKHVCLNKRNGRIPSRTFESGPEWVRQEGPKIENILALLRKQNQILADFKRLIERYEILEAELTVLLNKDRL